MASYSFAPRTIFLHFACALVHTMITVSAFLISLGLLALLFASKEYAQLTLPAVALLLR